MAGTDEDLAALDKAMAAEEAHDDEANLVDLNDQ
jgi:hypothetical protein